MSNRTVWVIFPLLFYVMNCRYLGATYHLPMTETSFCKGGL